MPGLFSVGLVELLASYLPHFSCAQRLLAEKMITIVAYFRARVVEFIFGGRNTGQRKSKEGGSSIQRPPVLDQSTAQLECMALVALNCCAWDRG